MKKLILACFLALALTSSAQETYSVALASPANVTKLDLGRTQYNAGVCARLSLSANCTQAQACVAANVAGGASCTALDAVNAGVRIYANTLNGREAFITNELVRTKLVDFVQKNAEAAMVTLRGFCLSANQAQKDALCTDSGQSAGCGLCDAFQ